MTATQIGVIIFVLFVAIFGCIYTFFNMTKEQRIKNLKQWLRWAVVEAEKFLGAGTGQLKLRYVYDAAVKQFPWLVTFIPFDVFSKWVDEALEWMKLQIETNNAINNYVLK